MNLLVDSLHSEQDTLRKSYILVKERGLGTNTNFAINKLCCIVSLSLSCFMYKAGLIPTSYGCCED